MALSGGHIASDAIMTGSNAILSSELPNIISSQYVLTFTPPGSSVGQRHSLSVRIDRPNLTVIARGSFISHENGTTGSVRVLQLADRSRVLRIDDLDTSNRPDLYVWLAAAPVKEGRDGWFVFDDDEHVSLGRLKGNIGDQNYELPADFDLGQYKSVVIWCRTFNVVFGYATLDHTS